MRRFVMVAFALLAMSVSASPAAAHAKLQRTEPAEGVTLTAAPASIALWFSIELASDGSLIELVDASGTSLASGGVDLTDPDHASLRLAVPAGLTVGTYTVRWIAVSGADNDDHAIDGSFAFELR